MKKLIKALLKLDLNIYRVIQLITGFHFIHHITFSYGFKIPLIGYGYFKQHGLIKLKGQYHNCTISNIY